MLQPSPETEAADAATTLEGVLPIDKPAGWTSFDVVAVVRRAAGIKRVGHGGTLDPLATGMLPVLLGRATRFADRLHDASKVYAARVEFGRETTTDDAEGTMRRDAPVPDLDAGHLDALLEQFRGEILQTPPLFSAIKVGGRRAYRAARAGEDIHLEARPIRIERLAIESWRPPSLRLLIVCGSGTYIRSLARDVGRACGSAAHLGALRRMAVGSLGVDRAVEPGSVRAASPAALAALMRPASDAVIDLDDRWRTAPAEELLEAWQS